MKAITMLIQKFSRPGVILLATVVVIITSMVVANATQTITTPNAAFISYNLTASTDSAAITLVTNRSVLVMGCCTPLTGQGVGQVSLLHTPANQIQTSLIQWVGLNSPTSNTGGATITSGQNNFAGTHIVWIDVAHTVDIRIGASGDTIVIHNGSTGTKPGNVTLVW